MGISTGLFVPFLVYAALLVKCAGFLARDELLWRPLMLAGSGLYIVYYFFAAPAPLWDAIVTNAILAIVNLAMIGVVIRERSTWGMSAETLATFELFPLLSPGHFRRLMKIAEREAVPEARVLVSQGEAPGHLHFVLSGVPEIRKNGHVSVSRAGIFIAEVAFLTNRPASATVSVPAGAEVLRWDVRALRRLLDRRPGLKAALIASLNVDLAQKVATSQPLAQEV